MSVVLPMVGMFYNHKEKKIFFADGENNKWIFVYHQRDVAVWESLKDVKAGGVVGSMTQKSDGFCHGVFDLNKDSHLKNMFKIFKKNLFPSFYEVEEKEEREILKVKIIQGKIILKDSFSEKILGEFEPNIKGIEGLIEKATFEIKKYCSS